MLTGGSAVLLLPSCSCSCSMLTPPSCSCSCSMLTPPSCSNSSLLTFQKKNEEVNRPGGAETCADRPAGPFARTPLKLTRRSPLGLLNTALEQSKLPKSGKSYLRERENAAYGRHLLSLRVRIVAPIPNFLLNKFRLNLC